MFDSLASDVSFPTRNPLHNINMTSLVHLSSTQSELEYSNVNYAGFDSNAGDEMNIIDDRIPLLPVIEKCTFQQNTIRLPPDIAFQVHLMFQLNKHRGNDLNMFHEIITCMKSHAVFHNVDFSTLQILSRKQPVQLLTKYYQMDFLKPRLHSVPLSGGTVATMTVFDVKALLIAFLNDPDKMRKETLHLTMIYSLEKLLTHSQELMKFTQDHCGNLRDKNIVVMTRMHSQWHWFVFTIRPIPMFLVLCPAPHSFVLQRF